MAPRRPAARRLLRGVGWTLLGLVGALFAAGAWTFSPWGGARVARFAETWLDERIDGTVHLGELSIGLGVLELRDVLVVDPEGRPTIAAEEIDLELDPWALLLGRLVIEDLVIRGGMVEVAADEAADDVTIGMAFQPEDPGPEPPEPAPGPKPPLPPSAPLPIRLERLRIEDTAFRLAESPGGPATVAVRDIDATISGGWQKGAWIDLALTGRALAPLDRPLAVEVRASFAENLLSADEVDVRLGDSRIRIEGIGEMRELDASLKLEAIAGAEEARAYGIPLASDVRIGADAFLSRERLLASFRAAVRDAGVVTGEARLDPEDGSVRARAVFEGLDPAAWLVRLPRGEVAGILEAEGDLTPEPVLDVDLRLRRGRLLGFPVGPARVDARLRGERLHLEEAWATIPGAGVSVVGDATPERLDLQATVKARDLARARRFLGAAGLELPELAGRGVARLTVEGPPERAALGYRLDFERLRLGDLVAEELRLRGTGRLAPGDFPELDLRGRAGRLAGGRFAGRDVRLRARRGPEGAVELDARAAGEAGPYALTARGRAVPGRFDLERFRFRYPEGELRLERPLTVEPGDGELAIRGLSIRGPGPGRIRGDVIVREGQLEVDLLGRDLRLDRLPQALVPEALSGRLDVEARLRGTPARPEGEARFSLSDGRVGPIEGIGITGDVGLGGGRAEGRIAARVRRAGTVRGTFAVPLDPLEAPARSPLLLDLRAPELSLAAIGEAAGIDLPAATVRARLRAGGTLGDPTLRFEAMVDDLELAGRALPPLDAEVVAVLEDGVAAVDVEGWVANRRVLGLEARAPLALRTAIRAPEETVRGLLRSEDARLEAEARGFDLAFVARLLGQPELTGPVAARVALAGPIEDPRGIVDLEVAARSLGTFDRVEGDLLVELGAEASRLAARVSLDGGPAAVVEGSVGASIRALLDGTALATAPATLSFEIPSLRLGRIAGGTAVRRAAEAAAVEPRELRPIPSPDAQQPAPRLAGIVEGAGRFEGTLADLRGSLRLVGRELRVGRVALGDAELAVEQGDVLAARLAYIDEDAGWLEVAARTGLALAPLPLLRDGLPALERVPVTAEVDAASLSLGPLVLIGPVVAAAGGLDLEARIAGTLGAPRPQGRLTVDDARVELITGQVLQGIDVLAAFEEDRLLLRGLEVEAPGRGRLVAKGVWFLQDGADRFGLEAEAQDFPIGGPGGVTARVTGRAEAGGTFEGLERGLAAKVDVPALAVSIPDRPPREVQPISRHRDVVIVTGPEALRRIRKSRLQAEEEALPVVVEIDAPDIRVDGRDVEAALAAGLVLRRQPDGEFAARGRVVSSRGEVQVLGRTFVIERAVVRFDGPLDQPTLSATARYEARDATAWVDLSGPVDDPEVRLRSDPPLPEAQIAVLIASGRAPTAGPPPVGAIGPSGPVAGATGPPGAAPGGVEAGGAAASVAGSFLAARLRQAVGPRLPIDVLVLESTREGGARIEAGTYLSERLYLGYLRDLLPEEGENINEIRAELELSRSFALESFFGDAASGGVDLVFERTLPTPGQRGARREARAVGVPGVVPGRAPAAFPPEPAEPDPEEPERVEPEGEVEDTTE